MEEKKLKTRSVEDKTKGEEKHKLSYEELNGACNQLFQENQYLKKQLQEANLANMFKRLDYLFEVLKYSSIFNDPGFVMDCVDEIKDAIMIKQPEETEKGN